MIPLLAALALGPQAHAEEPAIAYEKYELENGLDVILAPDKSTPIVYVTVWYHVGSKDEVEGLTGFAHLFEHLMFNGSVSVPDDYFKPLQEVGASINGSTSTDRTNYHQVLPARYLPLALFMESDRMGGLLPVLSQETLDNQREVVRNERRQRYENPPYGQAYGDIMFNLYAPGHPYHHITIGSHEDLEAAKLQDVKEFFSSWYVPNNAALVVAGDFDPIQVRDLIQENFGPIPRGPDVQRPKFERTPLAKDKVIRQFQDVP
ncbi:MAG: zinc protease, partial [Kiritimatiellia bacterium]